MDSYFPHDDSARKMMPIFKLITRYFPRSLREITKVSVANNVRYNPDRPPADINWARGKSPDQLGSLFRHMIEREVDGKIFEDLPPEVAATVGFDRVYVLAEAAWRALAALELEIEAQEKAETLTFSTVMDPLKFTYAFDNSPHPSVDAAITDCYCYQCEQRRFPKDFPSG